MCEFYCSKLYIDVNCITLPQNAAGLQNVPVRGIICCTVLKAAFCQLCIGRGMSIYDAEPVGNVLPSQR